MLDECDNCEIREAARTGTSMGGRRTMATAQKRPCGPADLASVARRGSWWTSTSDAKLVG